MLRTWLESSELVGTHGRRQIPSTWPGPGLGPSPGWGPVRVGAHMGPYGPIRALMLVFKSEAFRVQTAPFDKIRIEFRRSRRRLLIPDLLEAKKQRREIMIFKGVVFLSKVRRFGSRWLRLTK